MTIQLPAYLTGFASKVDGSASVRFGTQELTEEDFIELKRHHGQYGWLLFQENPYQGNEIPTELALDGKTPSKRMRDVLFVLWKQEGAEGDWETWYRQRMEKLIDSVKKKLD